MQLKLFSVFFFLGILFFSCTDTPHVSQGIQIEYRTSSVGKIISIPTFLFPEPLIVSKKIDIALLQSYKINEIFEKNIIQSFQNQIWIHGYPFSEIQKMIQNSKSDFLIQMENRFKFYGNRFYSKNIVDDLETSEACRHRKNFLDFYTFCVSDDKKWISNLNELSSFIHNAESALIPVITEMHFDMTSRTNSSTVGGSVLLIDTNNGKLIWGKSFLVTLPFNDKNNEKNMPSRLLEFLLKDEFWIDFPNRNSNKEKIHGKK